jgi:DNA-binding CsgD family transcriptional regulator
MERCISETEREVLRLHGAGLPPHEIARRLGISETTVTWIVATIVSEWGVRRTDDLAVALAAARRGRWLAQLALPVAVMVVLTAATAVVLSTTGTLHGPVATPSTTPLATSFGSAEPSTSAPPAADGATVPTMRPSEPSAAPSLAPPPPTIAPVLPTIAPVLPTIAPVVPTIAPVVPTLPPVVPTVAPSLPPPLPPLPTVPPLPTPRLPAL